MVMPSQLRVRQGKDGAILEINAPRCLGVDCAGMIGPSAPKRIGGDR